MRAHFRTCPSRKSNSVSFDRKDLIMEQMITSIVINVKCYYIYEKLLR